MVIVELDLYSGAPNPRWALDAASGRALDDAIARLDAAAVDAVRPARLGYRGLVIRTDDGDDIFVGGGYVFDGARVRADPDRRIERWLLASAVGHVDDRLLRELPGIG